MVFPLMRLRRNNIHVVYSPMSDIHGHMKPLEQNLNLINLFNNGNKLIFCGDYIDYGNESCKVLYEIGGHVKWGSDEYERGNTPRRSPKTSYG